MYPYIEIFNRQIPTYGTCMFLGFVTAFLLSLKVAKKYGYSCYDLLIIVGFALLLALPAGSILYTLVTYNFEEILEHLSQGNFDKFGGIVFYGAFIGGTIGGLIGIRVAKMDLFKAERIIVPFIPIGHAIGRIGCVMAGCCYGMEYYGPLALYYHNSVTGLSPAKGHFPVQLLEAMLNVIICLLLLFLRKRIKKKGGVLSAYLLFYGVVRFFVEFFRGDKIRGIYFSISTSQWISLVLFTVGALFLLLPIFKETKKDALPSVQAGDEQ